MALSNTVSRLDDNEKEVANNKFYTSFIEESIDALALIDQELKFVYANENFCQLLELPSNQKITVFPTSDLILLQDQSLNDSIISLMSKAISSFEIDLAMTSLSGRLKKLSVKMSRYRYTSDFEGGIMRLSDVTRYHEKISSLEEKLKETTDKNHQLIKYIDSSLQQENFAYIASHDMKEPLRMIGNFSQLLIKKFDNQLSNEANEYLAFILEGVKNMNAFVDDLLFYTKLERKEHLIQNTNFDVLFYILQNEFQADLNALNTTLQIDPIPFPIPCSKEKISILFQQLFSNSIKFAKKDAPLSIQIKFKELENAYEFQFKDNGIGMNEAFADKVLLLFKKLHPKSQYPGSGIGLSLCKKIVEQHGGQLRIQSKLGEGCNIIFTLKKMDNAFGKK